MKYVIFKRKTMFCPVIIPEHCTHSQISIEGFEPVSAGFFSISSCGIVEVDLEQGSDSLGLMPDVRDHILLMHLLCNSTPSVYMDLDNL